MRSKVKKTVATCGLLALAASGTWIFPIGLGSPRQAEADPAAATPQTFTVTGLVRDFKKNHPDFGSPTDGHGHHAANVGMRLNSLGRPTFNGFNTGPVETFQIVNGTVVPSVEYVPMITVLGSAISMGGSYDMPVTVNVHIGTQTLTPFGPFTQALAGNVNDNNNPREYVHSTLLNAQTPIWINGRSWKKTSGSVNGTQESHWTEHMMFSSKNNTQQVRVFRDGDAAPNINGYLNQTSAREYVKDYIDSANHIKLHDNQVIFLFELGVTSLNSAAADFQDVVVLITLGDSVSYFNTVDSYGNTLPGVISALGYKVNQQWRDRAGNPIPPHLFNPATDTAGVKGPAASGAITSASSFDQWYADVLGINLSALHSITLTKNASNVWEYLTDDFHPIDNTLFGNEGSAHNFSLTFGFELNFTHHAGEHRFVEFDGADDVWVFIDGKLAMDRGGVIPGTRQYLDVDRMGLTNNQTHKLQFFHAQRQNVIATFRLRLNLDLGEQSPPPNPTGGYD